MPPKKVKKAKKPAVQKQKQKQKQSQRVIVNVNQQKRAPAKRVSQPRQQVSYQPIITMSGSVPVPQPYYNPYPIQSSSGFPAQQPQSSLGTPVDMGVPVPVSVPVSVSNPSAIEVDTPVFGDDVVRIPVRRPVIRRPIRIPAPVAEPTPSIISTIRPAPAPPPSIISTIRPRPPPPSIIADSQIINPSPPQSISSIFSDLSRATGINSQFIADLINPPSRPPSRTPSVAPSSRQSMAASELTTPAAPINENMSPIMSAARDRQLAYRSRMSQRPPPPSSSSDSFGMFNVNDDDQTEYLIGNAPNNEPVFFAKENMSVAGSPDSLPTISTRPSFYNPSVKGGEFTNEPIITTPKEVVVVNKPERKSKNPYDIFSEAERSLPADISPSEGEQSIAIIPRMVNDTKKPAKKRPVVKGSDSVLSDTGANIIPQDAAGRRMQLTPIKEKKSSYVSKADLQAIARDNKINLKRPNGKDKTMNELRIEIAGK